MKIMIFKYCIDIDECIIDGSLRHNCDPDATCFNTDGSFNCSCNAGYAGNGISCQSK